MRCVGQPSFRNAVRADSTPRRALCAKTGRRDSPKLDPKQPNSVQIQDLTKFGTLSTDIGLSPVRPNFGRCWLNLGRTLPCWAKVGWDSTTNDQHVCRACAQADTWGDIGHNRWPGIRVWPEFVWIRTDAGRNSARGPPELGHAGRRNENDLGTLIGERRVLRHRRHQEGSHAARSPLGRPDPPGLVWV